MTIRPYSPDDRDACVEIAVRAFSPIYEVQRSLLGDDLFGRLTPDAAAPRAEVTAQRLDEDDVWVAVVDQEVAGFVAVFLDREQGIGHVDLVVVDPDHHRRGIGSALLDRAIEHIAAEGMAYVGAFPYTDPGHAPAIALLDSRGIEPTAAQPLQLIRAVDPPGAVDPHIRDVTPDDVARCVQFGVEGFRPVFEEMERQYGTDLFNRLRPDWERAQAEYVEEACTDPDRRTRVYEADGVVVGFSVCSEEAEGVERLEVIAVDPEHLGSGVGSALIRDSLDRMAEAGADYAILGTGDDPGHAPARRAYERAGFVPLALQRQTMMRPLHTPD